MEQKGANWKQRTILKADTINQMKDKGALTRMKVLVIEYMHSRSV